MSQVKQEVKMIVVALVCAVLLIIGHVVIIKSFAYEAWAEWTAGAIPFILFFIGWWSVSYCAKSERRNNGD